jgi:hypothetical protein
MCFAASKQYFEKYPGDHELLWEVEGVGHWHQRVPVTRALQREAIKATGKTVEYGTLLKTAPNGGRVLYTSGQCCDLSGCRLS